jgi:U3 small nucleolar RNA-associated protein 20
LIQGILNKVFVPLFFCMLFDIREGKGENVRAACIEALALVSGHVEWKSYYALLLRCLREMTFNPDKQKHLLRLTCSILDQFHFSEIQNNQKANGSLDNVSDAGTIGSCSSAILQKCSTSTMVTEIQRCLHKTVLPKIQKLLNSDSDKVNVNINLAALKLLKLLPGDIMDSLLPSIIHRISNFLKSRLESIRDEARSALAACLKELGLQYLQFIVRVLRGTLKRGYELHVLAYTLNFILSKSILIPNSGKLDYCLEDLLSVVENDILGDVAEEKEVGKIASKMKETKTRMSFKTLELIAQSITFKTHALKLLSPVTTHLQKQLTPKVKTELEKMLNHIAVGIEHNPSVDQTDLFIFVYGLIEDGIKDENCEREHSLIAEAKKHHRKDLREKRITSGRLVNVSSHLLIVFALRMLHKRTTSLKQGKIEHVLSMLDPFVTLLGNCLASKYEDILSASLSCLTSLVRLPLPSLESQADKIKEAVLDIAQSSVTSSSPLMQSCLRLLVVLLRSTRITLSSDQLHQLIQLPLFVDLEREPSNLALSLLKAIVNRKLVVPEIYDLVTQAGELMVTSQVDSIRKKCSQILLQFLLDYQLSVKRLQEHLDFLLSNLR